MLRTTSFEKGFIMVLKYDQFRLVFLVPAVSVADRYFPSTTSILAIGVVPLWQLIVGSLSMKEMVSHGEYRADCPVPKTVGHNITDQTNRLGFGISIITTHNNGKAAGGESISRSLETLREKRVRDGRRSLVPGNQLYILPVRPSPSYSAIQQ